MLSIKGVVSVFTIDDNVGRRFDWPAFVVMVGYAACVDAVAWMIGGPIGGVALLIAIWWYAP
ncbi:MAG TPA: hypothetical protein VHR97_01625 [Candidatus Baltobacteraceae bacterium]|jgi:hypothetical protein|nr:hypothetical protein [Candidatus Baltobacteraceae bacterium]